MTRDRYVFMVLKNQTKDLVKKRRRGELSIEELTTSESPSGRLQTRDSFDERYLCSTSDSVYASVENELALIPSRSAASSCASSAFSNATTVRRKSPATWTSRSATSNVSSARSAPKWPTGVRADEPLTAAPPADAAVVAL